MFSRLVMEDALGQSELMQDRTAFYILWFLSTDSTDGSWANLKARQDLPPVFFSKVRTPGRRGIGG